MRSASIKPPTPHAGSRRLVFDLGAALAPLCGSDTTPLDLDLVWSPALIRGVGCRTRLPRGMTFLSLLPPPVICRSETSPRKHIHIQIQAHDANSTEQPNFGLAAVAHCRGVCGCRVVSDPTAPKHGTALPLGAAQRLLTVFLGGTASATSRSTSSTETGCRSGTGTPHRCVSAPRTTPAGVAETEAVMGDPL